MKAPRVSSAVIAAIMSLPDACQSCSFGPGQTFPKYPDEKKVEVTTDDSPSDNDQIWMKTYGMWVHFSEETKCLQTHTYGISRHYFPTILFSHFPKADPMNKY